MKYLEQVNTFSRSWKLLEMLFYITVLLQHSFINNESVINEVIHLQNNVLQ